MSNNLHDVVKLLLARMKSHPEEFLTALHGRWREIINQVREYGTQEENDAIDAALRPIRLAKAHEEMMDELLNGDERRRRETEEQEYERSLMNRTQQSRTVLLAQQQAAEAQRLQNSIGINMPSRYPTSSDMEQNGIMNALRNIK